MSGERIDWNAMMRRLSEQGERYKPPATEEHEPPGPQELLQKMRDGIKDMIKALQKTLDSMGLLEFGADDFALYMRAGEHDGTERLLIVGKVRGLDYEMIRQASGFYDVCVDDVEETTDADRREIAHTLVEYARGVESVL